MKAAPQQPRLQAAAAVQEGDGRDQERRSREIKISTAWQKAIAFEPLTALIIIIIIIIILILIIILIIIIIILLIVIIIIIIIIILSIPPHSRSSGQFVSVQLSDDLPRVYFFDDF